MPQTPLTAADKKHRKEFAAYAREHGHEHYRSLLDRLYALWEDWNRQYFGGKLVTPHILLAEPKSPRAWGDHANLSGWGSKNQIRIRPSLWDGSHPQERAEEEYAEGRFLILADVLLHETIHQYHDEITGQIERGYHGHGPAFRDECNRIGKALGLPPVRTAKARGPEKDLPSCAHWPFNVRPEGYYRGALAAAAEEAKEGEEAEADEDASTERPAAEPEQLAKFLTLAIGQFEERFTITPEEKLEALHQVVKELEPKKPRGRRSTSR
jgi:hypothetical protein